MTQPTAVLTVAPVVPEQVQIATLAATEGFVSFQFSVYEGELIAEFAEADRVPLAFSEVGLVRRLTNLIREKKPHAFTEYVLAELLAKKAEAVR